MNINREAFPNIQYDIITIYTSFPGAAPSEVEKLITNPLEQELKEVDGIKKMFLHLHRGTQWHYPKTGS